MQIYVFNSHALHGLPIFQKDGIRFRQHLSRRLSEDTFYQYQGSAKKKHILSNGTQHLLFVLTFFLSVSLIVIVLEKNLPEPRLIESEGLYPGSFVAERARDHVVNLTSIGPRVAGSYENEVLAVKFLMSVIDRIVKEASENHKILVDVTRHSGAFPLTFLDGMTNVYRNVQNVIVKVGPHRPSKNSLLLNCHFDTFMESPGEQSVLIILLIQQLWITWILECNFFKLIFSSVHGQD